MITKSEEHEINRSGKRLLRTILEPLGWVVNDVQEDYGIDSNVQMFDGKNPTGAWFHVQLKSSVSSSYSANRSFISQELSVDHARHYAVEMRDPVLVIHVDVTGNAIFWYAPQLDTGLIKALSDTTAESITVRIPTQQQLPATVPGFVRTLEKIYLVLASRQLTSFSSELFAESLSHLPDQEALHRAFQQTNDTFKLQRIYELFERHELDKARPRTIAILSDPDSSLDVKFWARIQLEAIDYRETARSSRPAGELPKIALTHAIELQKLTQHGPGHLKFYSLIVRRAAELEDLVYQNQSVLTALHQHLEYGNPLLASGLYAKHLGMTKRITLKYNQCVRLARYAAVYPNRWALGRALTRIVNPIGKYLIALRSQGNLEAGRAFATSALQITKLAAWIGHETGDPNAVLMAILSALVTVQTEDSDAYRWAIQAALDLQDSQVRGEALLRIERLKKRWRGEPVDGDYHWDTNWQIIQNMAAAIGVDISDESDPLVRGLRIAAKDNDPERVLVRCEHIIASQGATGPIARRIKRLFNLGTAASKVVHCTLHNYHNEGKDLDSAYAGFKASYCDSCKDSKPRPSNWAYTDSAKEEIENKHREFVRRLDGTPNGLRLTSED